MSKRRVVVTGLGTVCPVGNDVEAMWENIKNGVCGIDEITHFPGRRAQVLQYVLASSAA